ncbi:hypothetical protein M2459_002780 [Parabacteroides sp. PF5-5]|uniref:hypothetical protein n=1 Tax=unclassified Parabacteroides TaxID=2649774 RepID=UPI0024748CC2|nr:MULTISPECIES: hypothetical protein [unclassified Parabacteroides]MDH6306076.1 hypothetical protein [Parabacteroides sp. PH5-39]MDH6317026.1 hypothetical protein [Parabacteroides sp. PF5-13]MDH6320779.1 hypothetical protein [Parabacteroides sp. PH5-13]MDH6324519.1 hypothetical protein [Parabacteroides sp. PH5-8]MDH6328211.1 hypothetical protein [Parabacteroides sp. PH5-41]
MKKELKDIELLKGGNSFKVPEGYFESFTSRMMEQLPEKTYSAPKKVTMLDRVRPWLYMAAVFAGLGLFFKAIVGIDSSTQLAHTDTLAIQSTVTTPVLATLQGDEEEEYLEYLENQYTSYILAEELSNYE